MKRDFLKILFIALLLFSVAACRTNRTTSSTSSESGSIFSADQTMEAAEIIDQVNKNELTEIKRIYKESEELTKALTDAMDNNDIQKVKEIAGELLTQINTGLNLGDQAISKIEEAKDLEINETYRKYLDLKVQALTKQVEAFGIRLKQTKFLREEFQVTNKQEITEAKAKLKEWEEGFKKKMEAAREYSQEANLEAKKSMQKAKDPDSD